MTARPPIALTARGAELNRLARAARAVMPPELPRGPNRTVRTAPPADPAAWDAAYRALLDHARPLLVAAVNRWARPRGDEARDEADAVAAAALLPALRRWRPGAGHFSAAVLQSCRSALGRHVIAASVIRIPPGAWEAGARPPAVAGGATLERARPAVPDPARGPSRVDAADAFAALVALLDDPDREIVVALTARGEEQQAVAERLGLTQPTVSRRHARALSYLRTAYSGRPFA